MRVWNGNETWLLLGRAAPDRMVVLVFRGKVRADIAYRQAHAPDRVTAAAVAG